MGYSATNRGEPGVVSVFGLGDFPDPVAGVITLEESTTYRIFGAVDIGANQIRMNDLTALVGINRNNDSLTSSHPTSTILLDSLFSSEETCYFTQLSITNTGGGDAFIVNYSSAIPFFTDCVVNGDIEIQDVFAISFVGSRIDGEVAVTGALAARSILDASQMQFIAPSGGACLNIAAGASLGTLIMSRTLFQVGFAASAGIRVDTPAQVASARIGPSGIFFVTAGAALDGFSQRDDTWRFDGCVGVPDSDDQGVATWSGAPVTVDLPGAQAWTDIAGVGITYALDTASAAKFALADSANGQLAFTGASGRAIGLECSLLFDRTAGTDIDIQIGVSVNGAVVAISATQDTAANRVKSLVTGVIPVTLNNGDTVRPLVRNVDAGQPTNDIDVSMVRFIAKE